MIHFRTRGGTPYACVPHVEDVGMVFVAGRIGGGKSLLLMMWLAMLDQYMAPAGGTIFLFDKDRGSEIAVHAMGGRYIVVRAGTDSGLSPLKGLADTPGDRTFLALWIRALIQLDGRGAIAPQDEARLARGVAATMRLPARMRTLLGLRQFLGWGDPDGAGARLERWCRGGPLGWAFDGEADIMGSDEENCGLVGYDLTEILDDAEISNAAGAYLIHRIRRRMDGRRGAVALDEFRKYFMHAQFAELVEDFLLTARKQNWVVILVTQQPEHVLGERFGATLVGQCHTQIYFPTPTADERVYREQLFLTEGEFRAIREDMLPGSRQFLLKRSGEHAESVIIDFDLSALPEYIAVLSGRANTVRFAEALRREHPQTWLREFMARAPREAQD